MTRKMTYWTDGRGRPLTDDNGDPIPRPNPALLRTGTTLRKTGRMVTDDASGSNVVHEDTTADDSDEAATTGLSQRGA